MKCQNISLGVLFEGNLPNYQRYALAHLLDLSFLICLMPSTPRHPQNKHKEAIHAKTSTHRAIPIAIVCRTIQVCNGCLNFLLSEKVFLSKKAVFCFGNENYYLNFN